MALHCLKVLIDIKGWRCLLNESPDSAVAHWNPFLLHIIVFPVWTSKVELWERELGKRLAKIQGQYVPMCAVTYRTLCAFEIVRATNFLRKIWVCWAWGFSWRKAKNAVQKAQPPSHAPSGLPSRLHMKACRIFCLPCIILILKLFIPCFSPHFVSELPALKVQRCEHHAKISYVSVHYLDYLPVA